jgi:hypothetical protein
MTKRMFPFEYPFSPEAVVIFFRENYGPMSRAFTAMGPRAQNSLQSELTSLWSAHNKATDASTRVEAEYLEVTAVVR